MFFSVLVNAQDLIVNLSAESVPTSNGFTATQNIGTNCYGGGWHMQGNQEGYPVVESGSHFFNPCCGGAATGWQYHLHQDINVSANAAAINVSAFPDYLFTNIELFAGNGYKVKSFIGKEYDIRNLQPGLYYIRVTDSISSETLKFIKK